MAYVDVNTPVVEQITLPSGNTYYVADREVRGLIPGLISGLKFNIDWDGTAAPVAAKIPKGVKVTYNGTTTTGTLEPAAAELGFHLVKSSTQPSSETLDIYDEYVVIKPDESDSTTWKWEKIGDTHLNLSDVVTGVTLNKQTDTVIGSDATFTVTQPTVALATGATAGTGVVSLVTNVTGSLEGNTVNVVKSLGTPSTKSAIGASSTFTVTQPTVALTSNTSAATGRVEVLSGVRNGIPTILGATASGTAVSASGDNVTALTGVKVTAQPTVTLTENTATATGRIQYVKSPSTATSKYLTAAATGGAVSASGTVSVPDTVEAEEVSVIKTVTPTSSRLVTTSIYGVGSTTTTASKATAATSQTTATGGTTASTVNTNLLKGISVTNGVLTFGAATLNTQTTTQQTFSDVTVPVKNSGATTVATGAAAAAGSGTDIVTAVTSTNATVAGADIQLSGSSSALKSNATFTVTQPTITLTSGTTGDVSVVTALTAGQTRYLSASARGTAVGADGTDTVLGTASTFNVTQPTVALYSKAGSSDAPTDDETTIATQLFTNTYLGATASGANVAWNSKDAVTAVTGYPNTTNATVIDDSTDVTITATKTNVKATASGGNVAWNSKDTVTALTNATSLTVTKGS